MTIDEAIAFIDDITWQDCGRYEYGTVPKVREQVKDWLEDYKQLKEYTSTEPYVRGYKQGRADEREKIEQMLSELPTINGYIDSAWLWNMFEKLKGEKNE